MKEANSFPTKITVSKQSNKLLSSPLLCLPNPLLNFRLFLSPLLCLCLPQFLKKSITTKSLFYKFSLSFTLPLSLSQKWNFLFCKFKKPECSPVTFCIFLSFFSFFLLGFLGLLRFAFHVYYTYIVIYIYKTNTIIILLSQLQQILILLKSQ